MLKIKNLKQKLIITAVVFTYVLLMWVTKTPCPFYAITGIKCFGCGMSRALISAVTLDFSAAFSYHFMFWSVPILYLCFLKDGKLFNKKWANISLYSILILGYLANLALDIL